MNSFKIGKAKISFSSTLLVGCKIKAKGDNNTIVFNGNGGFKNTRITICGNGNTIEFAEGVSMDGGDILLDGDSNRFIVGKDTKFCGKIHVAVIEQTGVYIGSNGLFSSDITIRTGDSHSILNLQGDRINESKDVTIGNHVWVGNHVIITKGVVISNDCVVGTGSVVTRSCEEKNVVLAGVPAKVVKRGYYVVPRTNFYRSGYLADYSQKRLILMKTMLISIVPLFIVWLCFAVIYRKKPAGVFLDRAHSGALRGYAILGILVAHIGQYAGANGIELIGSTAVSLFIILYGYGLQESYKQNGKKGFWQKKILRIYIPYILIQALWLLVSKTERSFSDIVLDFSLIKPLHPFGWFLRYLMVCYIIFYFTLFIKSFRVRMIAIGAAFAVWFVIRSTILIDITPFLQARQTLAFPIGILLSVNIEKIRRSISSKRFATIISAVFLLIGVGIYAFIHFSRFNLDTLPLIVYNFIAMFTCVFCAVGVIGLTYLIKPLQNKFMVIVSAFTMEIYLCHGYFLNYAYFYDNYVGIVLLEVLLCVTAVTTHYLCNAISYLIKRIFKRKENA